MNINTLKNSYVSFQSKIKFVDEAGFNEALIKYGVISPNDDVFDVQEKLENSGRYADYPYFIEDSVDSHDYACTKCITQCSATGITDKDEIIFSHLCPASISYKETWSGFIKNVEKMKAKNKSPRAFLTGGKPPDGSSYIIFEIIKGILDKANIPKTLIWGQKGKEDKISSSVFYSVGDDTWYVKSPLDPKTPEDLKEAYQYIKIDSEDELYLDGKPVDPAAVEKDEIIVDWAAVAEEKATLVDKLAGIVEIFR